MIRMEKVLGDLLPVWTQFCKVTSNYSDKLAIVDSVTGESLTYRQLLLHAEQRSTAFSQINASLVIIEGDETFDDIISLLACAKSGISIFYTSSDVNNEYIARLAGLYSGTILLRRSVLKSNNTTAQHGLSEANIFYGSYCYYKLQGTGADSTSNVLTNAYMLTRSSGSTGTPKLIWFSQSTIFARSRQSVDLFRITCEDRILACSPLLHSLGQRHAFISILTGATYVRLYPFNRDSWKQSVDTYSPSFWIPVSTHLSILKDYIANNPSCMNSFRAIVSSSSPIEASLIADITKTCGVMFSEIYGTTETACATYLEPLDGNIQSVGKAIPGSVVRIKDQGEDGIGEIIIKNDCMLDGYVGISLDDFQTPDGFFMSGDLGKIDGDGYLYYYGRKKESFNVLGKLIYPSQIEATVLDLGLATKCQIYPVHTSVLGTLIGLVIESGNQEECKHTGAALRKILPKEHLPAKIVNISQFPILPNGKQDRVAVKRLALERS